MQLLETTWGVQDRGCLRHPWTLDISGRHHHGDEGPQVRRNEGMADKRCPSNPHWEAAGLQVFTACLGLLGPVLHGLSMCHCWGTLYTSESLRLLWVCSRLRKLKIWSLNCEVMAADVAAGLQHLRCAAITAFDAFIIPTRTAPILVCSGHQCS